MGEAIFGLLRVPRLPSAWEMLPRAGHTPCGALQGCPSAQQQSMLASPRAPQVLEGLPEDTPEQPEIPKVKGKEIQGGPQMLQLRWGRVPGSLEILECPLGPPVRC